MSVSRVVVRLEVADDCPVLPGIAYEVGDFKVCGHEGEKLSYAEVTASSSHSKLGKDTLARHRGRRHFTEVIIETYITEEMEVDLTPGLHDGDVEVQRDTVMDPVDVLQATGTTVLPEEGKNSLFTETHVPGHTNRKKAVLVSGTIAAENDSGSDVKKLREKQTKSFDDVGPKTPKAKNRSVKQLSSTGSLDGCFPSEGGEGAMSRPSSGKGRGKSHSPTAQLPSTVRFFSGNPSVETTEGIIHLYKENQLRSLTDDVVRSDMICILTVPAAMNSLDFLKFMAPVEPGLENMKIIRDGTPNKYMVLVKFKDQKYADEFYKSYNNMPFNSIEPEICHLVYVAKVDSVKAGEGGSLPVSGLTELPVCPVCLERMDESVDGILTILCNHSFHSSCLAKWQDTSCPVCRYVQTPEPVEDNKCFECESQDSLWICLICGHVGCGRYVEGHAYRHFQETQHTYSLQLGNNRVWDYAGDNYVHRLVQNKGDGKLVEVDEGGNVMHDEKLDSITLEYTYLLTSQLESQRHYFEEKIELVEKEARKQVEEVEVQSKAALEKCQKLEQQLASAEKKKDIYEKKCAQLTAKLTKVQTELTDEKEMNKCLQQNQSQWQSRVEKLEKELEKKDKEIGDLQEQMRDIMFYFEAQDKLANTTEVSQDEIQGGQIIVGNSPQGATASGGKKGRKKTR